MKTPTTALIHGYAILLSIGAIALAVSTGLLWSQLSDTQSRQQRDEQVQHQAETALSRSALSHAVKAQTGAAQAQTGAAQAQAHAVQATQLAQAIAAERTASILRACAAQNMEHDATIQELDRLLAAAKRRVGRQQRKALAASRQFTVLLIDRLAPKQDCAQVAATANTAS